MIVVALCKGLHVEPFEESLVRRKLETMADILSCGGRWGYGEQEDHGEKGGKSDYHIKIALERLLEVEEQLDKRGFDYGSRHHEAHCPKGFEGGDVSS